MSLTFSRKTANINFKNCRFIGRPFVKRFALCYQTVMSVLSCLSVTFVHCGQTVRRIKTKLGMRVGVSPGHIFLDGDPPPLPKGAQPPPPIFSPCLLWSDSWIDQDATWYRGRPQTRQHCVTWGPSFPLKRGIAPPVFSAHIYCGDSAGNTVAKNSSVFSLIRMH